jgi:hypothetical protein
MPTYLCNAVFIFVLLKQRKVDAVWTLSGPVSISLCVKDVSLHDMKAYGEV